MSFLKKLLNYQNICIQCHNIPDPDTIASAYGVYCYLKEHGCEAKIIYSGATEQKKSNLKMLINKCNIPIEYVNKLPENDLLLLVDCQYGQGNVAHFEADSVAIIDHHIPVIESNENYYINSSYQSCSTIIWEMLCQENFPINEYPLLSVALLYGLYTDTSAFADLYNERDLAMKDKLLVGHPLFDKLIKSSMSFAEFMIASEAMQNHYFDINRRFAIVNALQCDQSVLGIIGDFIIQVDMVLLSFSYTQNNSGFQISIRSCHEKLPANKIAVYVCDGIGNGGGHLQKAGGSILTEKLVAKYNTKDIFQVVNQLLCRYIDEQQIDFKQ